MPDDIIVNGIRVHPYNEIFRWMNDDEMEGLVESVKYWRGRPGFSSGLLRPIILDRNGDLLDGKCRLRACEIVGTEPIFETFQGFDKKYPGSRKPYEEQCKALILSLNVYRTHSNRSQIAVSEAALAIAAGPGWYWEHRVLPEARIVAKHSHLVGAVMTGSMQLAEAYKQALQYEHEAQRAEAERQRLKAFREEQPFLALQVDEGKLSLDQAVTMAAEQAAAPVLAEHAEAIRFLGRRVISDIIEIGYRLTDCKALIGHGNWLPWLEREFGWGGESTALNFMRVYRTFGANPQRVADLDLPSNVFYLLAAPSTPAALRDEILDRAQHERVSIAEVKRRLAEMRPKPSSRNPHKQLRALVAKISREMPDDPVIERIKEVLGDGHIIDHDD